MKPQQQQQQKLGPNRHKSVPKWSFFSNVVWQPVKLACLITEIEQNELMSNKHIKACMTLNYFEHFLILASAVSGCFSISAFAVLLGTPIGITSSAIGLFVQ